MTVPAGIKPQPGLSLGQPEAAPPEPSQPTSENTDLFDYALIKDYVRYVFGAARRRKLIWFGVAVAVFALSALSLWALPRTYHVETKLMAQRNQVIASLSNAGRNMPFDSDAPTKAATETIFRRENMISLVKQTNLVGKWPTSRSPALLLKDNVTRILRRGKQLSMEAQVGAMVGTLETKLTVLTGEGTVTIAIDWPNALMAYELVDAAQRNFLETRHVMEVSTISEAISILEGHAAGLRKRISDIVGEIETAREAAKRQRPGAPRVARPKVAAKPVVKKRASASDQEVAQLKVMLEAKRRAIADLEEFRRARLAELQAKLAEQKATYSDAHPAVIDVMQRIEALQNQESLQLLTLRQEEQSLEAEAIRRGAVQVGERLDSEPDQLRRPPPEAQQILRENSTDVEDAGVEQAKGELRFAMSKYVSVLDRIDSAGLELESARAAFKYRYSVLQPAEIPIAPTKPKVPAVLGGGLVGGLILGLLLAVFADYRSGRVLEPWQVTRQLEVPIIGNIRLRESS